MGRWKQIKLCAKLKTTLQSTIQIIISRSLNFQTFKQPYEPCKFDFSNTKTFPVRNLLRISKNYLFERRDLYHINDVLESPWLQVKKKKRFLLNYFYLSRKKEFLTQFVVICFRHQQRKRPRLCRTRAVNVYCYVLTAVF